MLLIVYSFALFVVLLLGCPIGSWQMATKGKYREGLSERLGWVPGRLREGDTRRTIWVHAVSVGEVLVASRLVKELSACAPQYRVLLSTTTRTGQRLARERTGPRPHLLLPSGFFLDCAPLPAGIGSRAAGAGGDGVLAQSADRVPAGCDSRGGRQWTGFRSLPAALSAAALLLGANPGRRLHRAGAERGRRQAAEGDWSARRPGILRRQSQVRRNAAPSLRRSRPCCATS